MVALFVLGILASGVTDVLSVRNVLTDEKELKTRQLVESAHSVLAHFHDQQSRGLLSEDAARKAAIETIKAMRYDKREYFWLEDLGTPYPTMIMHPTVPSLDGKILDASRFNCATTTRAGIDGPVVKTDGKKNLFAAFTEVANRAGEGFVTYDWPKPTEGGGTTETLYPKISFVKKFEPWGWVVGSGIYIDDVQQAVRDKAINSLLVAGIAVGLLLLLEWLLAGSIAGPLEMQPPKPCAISPRARAT